MMLQGGIPFEGTSPLSKQHLQHITSYLYNLVDLSQDRTINTAEAEGHSQLLEPPKPEQHSGLFQFLDDHYRSTKSSDDDKIDTNGIKERPTLLNICSGNGIIPVTATHFNLCSQAIGIDADPLNISSSKKQAFHQKVLNKCHFFEIDNIIDVDPTILLNNPHFMADKINETDVVFLHALPITIQKLIPLLALLSSKRKERKFVTLINHLPAEFSVNPKLIPGTELCVYDGVVDNRVKRVVMIPPPPEPVDGDEIDKEFARSSIQHALPERF